MNIIVERKAYHYAYSGRTTLIQDEKHSLPENEVIKWLNGQHVTITWPDGYWEMLDLAVQPMRKSFSDCFDPKWKENSRLGYITLKDGRKEYVILSRLENVAYGYYRPILISKEERETFTQYEPTN